METPNYTYMENPKSDLTGFRITDGVYKDVVYTYGKVQPVEENDKLRLKFEYNVVENPSGVETEDKNFINVPSPQPTSSTLQLFGNKLAIISNSIFIFKSVVTRIYKTFYCC